MNYIQQILTLFKNKILNAAGAERSLLEYIQSGDISGAINLMQDRDEEVDNAIMEYNPETHKVMHRPDKFRSGKNPYRSVKSPRSRQDYINEVELFFILGNPIEWKKKEGDDEAFTLFQDFLESQFYHDGMCTLKRLAGAETEAAKLYHIYRENGEARVKSVILSRSEGYTLRPMFDQYGNLLAFAYGYKLKENGRTIQHWDIETPEFLFFTKRAGFGWEVQTFQNPTGKINVIYAQQRKAWHGVQLRIEREEDLDSKEGDTNNYFADPIATATADVIDSLADPETIGKVIQLSTSNSTFGYVEPPRASESLASERKNLKDSILFDTYTPDLSYENLKGLGSLSGVAIKNAMAIGYIKRKRNIGYYKQLVRRDYSVMIEILCFLHPEKADGLRAMKVEFEFAEPFDADNSERNNGIISLYQAGLISLEEAVRQVAACDDPDEEVRRIREDAEKKAEEKKSVETDNETAENPEEIPQNPPSGGKIEQSAEASQNEVR